jgi:hypothetical protein
MSFAWPGTLPYSRSNRQPCIVSPAIRAVPDAGLANPQCHSGVSSGLAAAAVLAEAR